MVADSRIAHDRSPAVGASNAPAFVAQPLYKQVGAALVSRIIDRRWPPGQMLPSEQQLAIELGVSPGTVRKALDSLVQRQLVVRRQGRGTFVAEFDEDRILFQFFRIKRDGGRTQYPDSRLVAVDRAVAGMDERKHLMLAAGAVVIRLNRVRSLGGTPAIAEAISLPEARFPKLDKMEVPNNLYHFYSVEFGQTIVRASERLKALPVGAQDAALLQIAPGAPVLEVLRVAFALDDKPVELRRSICRSDQFHYAAELT